METRAPSPAAQRPSTSVQASSLSRSPRPPGWRSLDILRATALVAGFCLFLALLWVAHDLIFITFLGILFGLAVASGADFLERFRIPRGVGAVLVVVAFLGVLVRPRRLGGADPARAVGRAPGARSRRPWTGSRGGSTLTGRLSGAAHSRQAGDAGAAGRPGRAAAGEGSRGAPRALRPARRGDPLPLLVPLLDRRRAGGAAADPLHRDLHRGRAATSTTRGCCTSFPTRPGRGRARCWAPSGRPCASGWWPS